MVERQVSTVILRILSNLEVLSHVDRNCLANPRREKDTSINKNLDLRTLRRACQVISNHYLVAGIGVTELRIHRERAFQRISGSKCPGRSKTARFWRSSGVLLVSSPVYTTYVHRASSQYE